MYKIDLHTHSTASSDGGLSLAHYKKILDSGVLDCVAVTDHNRIDFAILLREELGEQIIIGEEIMTTDGEIIGLFLEQPIRPQLSAQETIGQIKDQGGLVYLPHPFETVRKGLRPELMEELHKQIDIIEICNGRALAQNRASQAVVWARLNNVVGAASSDAHGWRGIGKTYTSVKDLPTRDNLLSTLGSGIPITDRPSLRALLYPKFNRMRRRLGGSTNE